MLKNGKMKKTNTSTCAMKARQGSLARAYHIAVSVNLNSVSPSYFSLSLLSLLISLIGSSSISPTSGGGGGGEIAQGVAEELQNAVLLAYKRSADTFVSGPTLLLIAQ